MAIWVWTLGALFVAYFINCFRIIGPNEVAVRIFFGIPRRVVRYGPKIIFWPFEKLVIYPTKALEFEFDDLEVTTSAGEYGGYFCEKAVVVVERPTLYFQWPHDDDDTLTQSYKNLPGPNEMDELKDIFEEIVINTIRRLYSPLTWKQVNENPQMVYDEVIQILKDPKRGTANPFFRGGVKPLSVEVKGIRLPEELRAVITRPEVARHLAQETVTMRKAEAEGIELIGKSTAEARRALFEAIHQRDMPKEALLTLREIANKGTTFAILPPDVFRLFDGILGRKSTEKDVVEILRDPDVLREIKRMLTDTD